VAARVTVDVFEAKLDRTASAGSTALISIGVAGLVFACTPSNAQKPAASHVAAAVPSSRAAVPILSAPSATASARPSTTPTPRPARQELAASGYIGKRGIVGTLRAEDSRWRAAFHFVDGGPEIIREGTATPMSPDPAWEADRGLQGLKVHSYLECAFEELAAAAPSAIGTITDARCLQEEQGERGEDVILEIAAAWSIGAQSEPFYLRTAGVDAIDNQDYLAAALATATPKHDCPPFVEILSADERSDRTTIAYTLRWPCDPEEERDPDRPRPRASAQAAPPSHEAYVADVGTDAPHPLLWSTKWTALPDPDELNVVHLGFSVISLDPNLFLYVGHVSDEFQSPNTGSGNSSERITLWGASAKGRHGPPLELLTSESGRAGWCMSWSKTNSATLLNLSGDALPELVIRHDEAERHDAASPNGDRDCVDGPSKTSFLAHGLNTRTLAWKRTPIPRGFTEQALDQGTALP